MRKRDGEREWGETKGQMDTEVGGEKGRQKETETEIEMERVERERAKY